jgi:hypothetical protein
LGALDRSFACFAEIAAGVFYAASSSLTKVFMTHGLERGFADKKHHKPSPERSH